ncbi:hypothetical protein [Tunturiibacter gelidiferens]|uniref:hypothetical protein n=1 Tax=Tunturiibacter gelidiferens TaxID=3069689 RepID=UPI003C12BEF7
MSPFREDGVTYGTPTWIWSVSSRTNCTSDPTTEGHVHRLGLCDELIWESDAQELSRHANVRITLGGELHKRSARSKVC